ncbi:MAG: DUF2520 domain-containing protein [Bacteroidota bacterium]
MIQRIAMIGAGRLAWSLIPTFQQVGIEVFQLISRDSAHLNRYQKAYQIPHTSMKVEDLVSEVDLVLLSVSDGAIQQVANQLSPVIARFKHAPIVAHSSGSIPLAHLQEASPKTGIFYPLQIFTPHAISDLSDAPFFIEGKAESLTDLQKLASKISPKVYEMSSEERLRLHMGAVIACNFSNYLYKIAQDQLPNHLPLQLNVYEPLLRMTLEKALQEGPEHTQTGPAIRADLGTLQAHLKLLEEDKGVQDMYRMMTKMINPRMDL